MTERQTKKEKQVSEQSSSGETETIRSHQAGKESFVLSLFRLMRIPNVFTAIADVMMGFAFMHQSFQPTGGLIFLIVATACLYSAGMILNDVFDIEVDTKERPDRPIPSGAVSLRTASLWGTGLLTSGFLFASTSYLLFGDSEKPFWFGFESSVVAFLLIIAILLYNKVLKKTVVAPIAMGSCRFLNILLGMSLLSAEKANLVPAGILLALSIGVFVAGVTWFARSEARESDRGLLTFGFAVMITGLVGVMMTPFWGYELPPTVAVNKGYLLPFMIALIGISVARLGLAAIADPIPQNVQMTIKQCILSLILINAAVCLWIDPQSIYLTFSVVVLIFPAILLGRWFKST